MITKNSYKITEDLKFNKIIYQKDTNTRLDNMINNRSFKLTVVKRSKFSSKSQMMKVIVKNSLDGSFRLFVKGAPEKVIEMCIESSAPVNFEEVLISHTKNGYRAIACATKPLLKYSQNATKNTNTTKNIIEESNCHPYDVLDQEIEFNNNEKDLTFLGFILLKNKLNKDTVEVIQNLYKMGCNLRISTGDHPITSISVASQCDIIKNQKEVFLCDIKEKENIKTLKM
jgi:cation-transporting ATPase 13A2